MTRKIMVSLLVIAVTAVMVGAGTFAYFSDTETSTGNTFTAGTLNLQVGNSDPTGEAISIANRKPTDTGNAATWLVENTGSLAGDLAIAIGAVVNNENVLTEPEAEAGDTTSGVTEGELGGLLKVAIWLDMDKDGLWDTGDKYLVNDGTVVTAGADITNEALPSAAYQVLNTFSGDAFTKAALSVNIAGTTEMGNFRVEYDFPDGGATDNRAQSDSSVFDITFILTQS